MKGYFKGYFINLYNQICAEDLFVFSGPKEGINNRNIFFQTSLLAQNFSHCIPNLYVLIIVLKDVSLCCES